MSPPSPKREATHDDRQTEPTQCWLSIRAPLRGGQISANSVRSLSFAERCWHIAPKKMSQQVCERDHNIATHTHT